jgi:hypothetical protein
MGKRRYWWGCSQTYNMEMGHRHVVYHIHSVFFTSHHFALVGWSQSKAIRRARQLQDALPALRPKAPSSGSLLAIRRHRNHPPHLRLWTYSRSVHDRRRRELEVGDCEGYCAAGYRYYLRAGMDHLGEESSAPYGTIPPSEGSGGVGCVGHRYHSQLW